MACRIMGVADGGHILASRSIYEQAQRWLSPEYASWKPLGRKRCKLGEPVLDIYEVYNPHYTLPMKKLGEPEQELIRLSLPIPPSLAPCENDAKGEAQGEKPEPAIDKQQM